MHKMNIIESVHSKSVSLFVFFAHGLNFVVGLDSLSREEDADSVIDRRILLTWNLGICIFAKPTATQRGRPTHESFPSFLLKPRCSLCSFVAKEPIDAAARSDVPRGRARGRSRFHRRGKRRHARRSWLAAPRAPPSRVGIRRSVHRRQSLASPRAPRPLRESARWLQPD